MQDDERDATRRDPPRPNRRFFSFRARTHEHTHEHTRVPDSTGRFVSFPRLDSTRRSEAKRSEVRRPTHPSITPSFRGRARIPDDDYDYHYYHKRRVMTRRLIASGVASAVGNTHTHTLRESRARVVYCVFYILYHTVYTYKKYHDDASTKHE